jgi:hypothetical protein
LLDGTHRTFTSHFDFGWSKVVYVENSSEALPSKTHLLSNVQIVEKKPIKVEERYTSYSKAFWRNVSSVSIDG